jgi:predicted AlkP superfamily pyrophosphatase or phosphodiesterase
MMKTIYSKTHSLVNLSNTILAHYGVPTHHAPIPSLLKLLKNKPQLCLLLFDGMGQAIVRRHLAAKSWLRKHYWKTITSTFPSTTAAATNAFLSGKYPVEIGWFGWSQYFKEYDLILELFTGRDYLLQKPAIAATLVRQAIDYPSIFSQIQTHQSEVEVQQVWPDIRPGGAKTLTDFFGQLDASLTPKTTKRLTYGYWLDPDKSIHRLGVGHPEIKRTMLEIEMGLKTLTSLHPQTTFIVFADHGLIDIEFLNIQQHPSVFNTLIRSFALEPRAATFYVKPGQSKTFQHQFKKYYGRHFHLVAKENVFKRNIYGLGQKHSRADDFIGDFVAISHSKYAFTHGIPTDTMPKNMRAHHAGMTKKEMLIDVMIVNR